MTTTYLELFNFCQMALVFIEENPKHVASEYFRLMVGNAQMKEDGSLSKYTKEYNKKVKKAQLSKCSVDANGNIMVNDNSSYKYTPTAVEELEELIDEINNQPIEIDFTPEHIDFKGAQLTPYQAKVFKQFTA